MTFLSVLFYLIGKARQARQGDISATPTICKIPSVYRVIKKFKIVIKISCVYLVIDSASNQAATFLKPKKKDGPGPVMVSDTLCPAVHILGT